MIFKLIKSGIRGNLIKWLHNFFLDRKIKVLADGQISNSVHISAGTPQGAILSPLLFNLMMIDIPQSEHVQLYIYADDITASCSGRDPHLVVQRLQSYLNDITKWADKWGLLINPQKSVVQHFTKRKIDCPVTRIKGIAMPYKKEQKLLGLHLDSPCLRFRTHITELKKDLSLIHI